MAERRTVYFTDHSLRLLSDTFAGGNVSNKVNQNIDRYHEILMDSQRHLAKQFVREEMSAILTTIQPIWKRSDRALAIVADFHRAAQASARAGHLASPVVEKLMALQLSHVICLVEAIENENKE